MKKYILIFIILAITVTIFGCIQHSTPNQPKVTPAKPIVTTTTTAPTYQTIREKILAKYTPLEHYISKIILSKENGTAVCTVKYNNKSYYVVCSNGLIVFANESGTLIKNKEAKSFVPVYTEPPLERIITFLKQHPNAVVHYDNASNMYYIDLIPLGNAKLYVKPDGTIIQLKKDEKRYVKFIEINTSVIPTVTPPPEFLKHLKENKTENFTEIPKTNETEVFFYFSPECHFCHEVLPLALNWSKYIKTHICNIENPIDPACKVFINKIEGVPVAFVVKNGTVEKYLGANEIRKLNDLIVHGKIK